MALQQTCNRSYPLVEYGARCWLACVFWAFVTYQRPLLAAFPLYNQSDDIVDPKPALEEQCHAPCKPLFELVKACEVRVAKSGEGTCEPWLFDYVKCVDKCVRTCTLIS
jgi:ubiquinol-cytochrome c reductase subunit 6